MMIADEQRALRLDHSQSLTQSVLPVCDEMVYVHGVGGVNVAFAKGRAICIRLAEGNLRGSTHDLSSAIHTSSQARDRCRTQARPACAGGEQCARCQSRFRARATSSVRCAWPMIDSATASITHSGIDACLIVNTERLDRNQAGCHPSSPRILARARACVKTGDSHILPRLIVSESHLPWRERGCGQVLHPQRPLTAQKTLGVHSHARVARRHPLAPAIPPGLV